MMKINFSHTTARIEIQMFFLIEIEIYRFQFMLAHQTKKKFCEQKQLTRNSVYCSQFNENVHIKIFIKFATIV